MNNKKNLLLSLLYVGIYAVVYFYLKNSGLWGRYRWTGLVFGAVVSAIALLLRNNRKDNFGLRVSILFCAAGIIVLLHFLVQHGGSEQGFLASLLLGFAAQGLYAHYKTQNLVMDNHTGP